MGEGATGVNHEPKAAKLNASELEQQIDDVRAELGELVEELDRRRHEALDIRLQLRRHAGLVGVVSASLAIIVAGRVRVVRRRRAHDLLERGIAIARVLSILAREASSWRRALIRSGPVEVIG
jgi:hypothetical protein